jgi:hypothetical protein
MRLRAAAWLLALGCAEAPSRPSPPSYKEFKIRRSSLQPKTGDEAVACGQRFALWDRWNDAGPHIEPPAEADMRGDLEECLRGAREAAAARTTRQAVAVVPDQAKEQDPPAAQIAPEPPPSAVEAPARAKKKRAQHTEPAQLGAGVASLPNAATSKDGPPAGRTTEKSKAQAGLAEFRRRLWNSDRARMAFPSIELQREAHTVLRVTVADEWLGMNAALRKKNATDLWMLWVDSVGGHGNADHWRISIVDTTGEEHAGSRFLGGSLIWTD